MIGFTSIARAVAAFRDLRGAAIAVVAVGLAVATADRPVLAGADLRDPQARPLRIGGVAEACARLAPEAGVAWDAGNAATGLTDADRGGGAHEQGKSEPGQERGRGLPNEIMGHGRPPHGRCSVAGT